MALDANALKAEIIAQMTAQGFNITNPATGGQAEKYIDALSKAIVSHITSAGQANVTSGSSSGTHPII